MAEQTKYGVARHFYLVMVKRGVVDFAVGADWTPVAGDVKISIDGGAAANVTNLPTAIAMGNTAIWDWSATAAELTGKQIIVTVADSATKAVEDQSLRIETFGSSSAQHAVDQDVTTVVRTGTAQAGAAGTITLDSGASSVDDFYKGQSVLLTGGTGAGQVRLIHSYAGSTKVATVGDSWAANPDNTSTFALIPARVYTTLIKTDAVNAAAVAADAVTELQTGVATAASQTTLASAVAAVQADTDDIQTRIPAALVSGRMDSSVGAMASAVLTAAAVATDAFGALELAADAATEIATAVWAQAMSELSAAPAPTDSVLAGLEWLVAVARNLRAQTRDTETIYKNDGVTVLATAPKSIDGTTFTRGRYT